MVDGRWGRSSFLRQSPHCNFAYPMSLPIYHLPSTVSMSLRERLFDELDCAGADRSAHAHQSARSRRRTTLADILGYHYYTELAHSAGMPREQIEEPGLDPKEKVAPAGREPGAAREHDPVQLADRDVPGVLRLRTTTGSRRTTGRRCTTRPQSRWRSPTGRSRCCKQSKLEAVFLTNDFDDPLDRLRHAASTSPACGPTTWCFTWPSRRCASGWRRPPASTPSDAASLRRGDRQAVRALQVAQGAGPVPFRCRPILRRRKVSPARANTALAAIHADGADGGRVAPPGDRQLRLLDAGRVCAREFKLPFDLMIGVNRGVYRGGRLSGPDLYDSRVSLIQYRSCSTPSRR